MSIQFITIGKGMEGYLGFWLGNLNPTPISQNGSGQPELVLEGSNLPPTSTPPSPSPPLKNPPRGFAPPLALKEEDAQSHDPQPPGHN